MIDTFASQVPIKIIVSSTQIHDKTMNSINGQWIHNSNKNLSEWLADKYKFDGDHTLRWGLISSGLQPLSKAAKIIKQLLQAVVELPAEDFRWGSTSLQKSAGSTKQPASSALDTTY